MRVEAFSIRRLEGRRWRLRRARCMGIGFGFGTGIPEGSYPTIASSRTEGNDFLRHKLFLGLVRFRLFFFAFGGLFIGQTKERRDRLPHPRRFVLLLEL